MRAHHIRNGIVVNTIVVDGLDVLPGETLIDADLHFGNIGDAWDGASVIPRPRSRDPQDVLRECQEGAQQRLDAFARTRNYDGILSACTYATSPTPKFAAEGQYCIQARDATWAALYAVLAAVQGGQRPMPTGYAEIEGELPILEWP